MEQRAAEVDADVCGGGQRRDERAGDQHVECRRGEGEDDVACEIPWPTDLRCDHRLEAVLHLLRTKLEHDLHAWNRGEDPDQAEHGDEEGGDEEGGDERLRCGGTGGEDLFDCAVGTEDVGDGCGEVAEDDAEGGVRADRRGEASAVLLVGEDPRVDQNR